MSGYPSTTTAGTAQNFTVTVKDYAGAVDTGYTGTIHFTSSDPQATTGAGLPSDYTFTTGSGGDNGTHTFSATLKTAGSQSITAHDTTTAIIGRETGIIVNPAAPSSLVVSGYPSPTTVDASHTFTVTVVDSSGNITTSYTGTIHFTSSDIMVTAGAGLPSDYTFTTGTGDDNGVHIFNATLKTPGSQSISATDTVNSALSGTESGITVNPAPPSSLVISGYPSPTIVGAAHTFTVRILDSNGNVATGYTGTLHFTSSDTKVTAGSGLPADYTFTTGTGGDNGVHTFTATLDTAGSQSITAADTVTSTISGTQSGITVNPAGASSLVVAAYPSPTSAGSAHTFTVTMLDPEGNIATGYTGTVHFTSSDSKATAGAGLPSNYTFTSGTGSDNGAHTFNATLYTAGSQAITATDTANGALSGSQSGITVNPAAASSLVLSGYPSLTSAGAAHTFTVTMLDPSGNVATGYTGTIHFTSSDTKVTAGAGLPSDYTFTTGTGGDNGVHTFSAALKTAGSQTIAATDTGNGTLSGSQSGITVNPATASSLVIAGYPSPTTSGAAHNFTVTILDADGNVVTGYTGTIHFTSSDSKLSAGVGLPSNYTFTTGGGGDNGTHTFNATLDTAGSQSITATETGNGTLSGSQSSITVNPAAASSAVIAGYPSPTAAGATHTFMVTMLDPDGNIATAYSGTIHFTSSDSKVTAGAGLPSDYTFSTGTGGDNGVHTFSAALRTAGSQSITATDTGNGTLSGSQSGINVNPAAASGLVVAGYPSPTTAGAAHSLTVTILDSNGNIATGYTGTIHFASSDSKSTAGAGLPSDYTFTSGNGDDNGVHTFSATLDTAGSQSITATDTGNGTLSGSQSGITVNPAAASTLVVTAYPSPTSAGAAHTFTVTILDSDGNIATAYSGTIHFTSSDSNATAGAGLPSNYTFTTGTGADNGVHTFSATLKTAGSQSITATDTVNSALSGTQSPITVNSAAASSLLVAGYPSPTTIDVAHTFTVTILDPDGNVATGYSGTIHFTSSDSMVTVGAGLPSDYTFTTGAGADDGVHTFSATLKTPGSQSITATDTANSALSGTQSGITVNSVEASSLVVSGFASPTSAGAAHTFTVSILDPNGNVATGYTGTIHFSSSDGMATAGAGLPADYTFTTGTGGDNGVHTFSATLKTAGSQSITATDIANSAVSGSQSGITVNPASASSLVVSGYTSSTIAGVAHAFTVTVFDSSGNVATGYTGTIHFNSSDAKATAGAGLPSDYSFTTGAGNDNGVHTFAATLATAGSQSITATDKVSSAINGTQSGIAVNPAAASQIVINQQPSATAATGQPFTSQPVIYEEDQYDNILAGDNTSAITASLHSGAGPLLGTTNVIVSGGVARFAGLADNRAETITLEFTIGSLASLPSNPIVVNPAGTAQLVIHTEPSSSATAGHAFATQPVVYIEDPSGNLETTDNTTVVTASLSSGSGPLGGTVTATAVGGIATFTNLDDILAETISLKFSGDGLSAGPSTSITVSPAAAFRLVIHTQPSTTATAGEPFATQPVVYEVDQFGNLETLDSSTVLIASLATGNGPLIGLTSETLVGGIATFTNLANDSAGAMSLLFSGGGLTVGPSNTVNVSPGPASQFVIQTPPYASIVAGNPLTDPIVLDEVDQYGNIETGDNTTVVTASLHSGAGTLKGTMTATVKNGVASFDDLENDTAGTLTLQFVGGTLPATVSAPSLVSPAPATKVVVTSPPSGIVSGQAFQLTVDALDPYGNVDTSYNGSVTVALPSGSAGILMGTTTVTATSGVATFSDLVETSSGPTTLDVSSGTLAAGNSGPVTVTPAPAAKLVVQMQPTQTATAGVPFNTQPVIYEEDAFGNIVTNDNTTVVTAYLGSGTGALGGTVAETITGGIATFSDLSDNSAGTITLLFTGAGLTSIPSVPVVINPAAAAKLVIQTQPSASATSGQAFATQPVIAEEDKFGNLETSDSSTQVTASLATGIGPLQGTTTIALSGGMATFTNLADDTAESISLSFSGGGFSTAPSDSIAITPAPSKLVIHTEPSTAATAGQAFAIEPVIYEEDQFGNVVTADNSTVITASISSGDGPLKGTTSVTVIGGVATFTNLSDNTAETLSLDFSAIGLIAGPSTDIVVKPSTASTLLIHIQPAATATAGGAFSRQPVIYEEDRFGNLETGDDNTLVTVSLATGAGPLHGTTVLAVSGGIATFTDLSDNLAETATLEFTAGNLATPQSLPIVVSPAQASKLLITTPPSLSATAGQPFATQPVISEVDKYGNVESGDSSTVVTASLSSGTGPLQGTTAVTLNAGVATFAGLADDTAEAVMIDFSGGGLSAGPSTVLINRGAAAKLVIKTQPSSTATAGQAFTTQPVIWEEDIYGNLESSDNNTVVTASLASGTGPLQGTVKATLSGGIATFTALAENTAETIALKFTAAGVTSLPTNSIVVSSGAATHLVIAAAPPGTVTAGDGFGMVVEAIDLYGNIDRSYNGMVTLTLASNPNGETLSGNAQVAASAGVATFSGLTIDKPGGSFNLQASSGKLASVTTGTIQVMQPPVPPTPTVLTETITTKKVKKSFTSVIKITYSIAMDSTSAGSHLNYLISANVKGKKNKKPTALVVNALFDQPSHTVTLTVTSKKNPFPAGGKLMIVASSPSGVHSQANVYLSPSSLSFTISPNGQVIMAG